MTIRKFAAVQPHLLAVAVALATSSQVQAIDFKIGEIRGQFDSSLSIGASWAVRGPDPDFVSTSNITGLRGGTGTRSADDNRQNFKKGETFSKIFKGLHDLELKYGDSGVFVRGKYWYDFELKDEHRLFYDIQDNGRDDLAKSSGAEFLDAFVYHNYTLGELAGNVRVGKQVVSWGESTFIGNSINSANPVDAAALRRPGSEVKEGLIPVSMLYVSQAVSENLNVEGFYQLEWRKSVVDNCGTFFGVDPLPQGCNDRLVAAGPDFAQGDPRLNTVPGSAVFERLDDNDARDSGQYGLALRWFVPELDDLELGAYVMNYHSRSPTLNFVQTTVPRTGSPIDKVRNSSYFVGYPEDIRLYGLSFSTNVEGIALGGEISYRPNMPLGLNNADVNNAAINTATSPLFVADHATPNAPGSLVTGYKRMPVFQGQLSATKSFAQILGGERMTVIGEVGYTRINGLGDSDGSDLRFGRSSIFGGGVIPGGEVANAGCLNTVANPHQQCNDKGFYTTSSWGYRVRVRQEYPNVIAGINLAPNVAWSHDVDGNGPTFEEGSKAVSLGVDADYRNTYTASLNYTDFFGGEFNTNTDRDYVSLSFGVNF